MAGWYKDPKDGYYSYVQKAPPGGVLRTSVPAGQKYWERTTGKPMVKNTGTGGTPLTTGTGRKVPVTAAYTVPKAQVRAAAQSYTNAKLPTVRNPGSSGGKTSTSQLGKGKTPATTLGAKPKPQAVPPTNTNPYAQLAADALAGGAPSNYQGLVPNITPWKLGDPSTFRKEAQDVTNETYKPLFENYTKQFGNIGEQNRLGREDIQTKNAQYKSDIEALYKTYGEAINQNKLDASSMAQKASELLGQQSAQTQQGIQQSGTNIADYLGAQARQMGLGETALPGQQNVLRDESFLRGLMGAQTQSQQQAISNQNLANTTMYDMLNQGAQGQSNMMQQQSQYASNQALRELEQSTLEKIAGLQGEQAQTTSKSRGEAYDLYRALLGEDWQKYMDTSQQAFGQQQAGAQLGLDYAQLQQKSASDLASLYAGLAGGGSGGSGSTLMTPYDISQGYLKSQITDQTQLGDYQKILDLLANPLDLSHIGGTKNTPVGTYSNRKYEVPWEEPKTAISEYYGRAWQSLADRGYVKSPNDANWQVMKNMIDRLFNANVRSVSNNASF